MATPQENRAARNRRYRLKHPGQNSTKRFIGVDGEGAGTDAAKRQNYLLLRAGDYELFRGNRRLSTAECLDFILSLPNKAIYIGYYFTYDATQILRDLPRERLERLLRPKIKGRSPYTFWRDFAIDFVPGQYFRVARLQKGKFIVEPNSARTINECGGFFQKPFLQALRDFGIGNAATLALIAEGKERRATVERIGAAERAYCAAECKALAQLMTKFRASCADSGIMPRAWRGAGHIAARLHEIHRTPKRDTIPVPAELSRTGNAAYYGGRFEVTQLGGIEGPIYEYDINSAYPAAMLMLPCPIHTRWESFDGGDRPSGDYIASVKYSHARDTILCGLPMRRKGRLYWPRNGNGTYWGSEIDAACRAGAVIEYWRGGFRAIRDCECRFFSWVEALYRRRVELGRTAVGYPIKLGLAGLYGKLAQRVGGAPYRNQLLAGMITAQVRAWLIDAYMQNPEAIIMLATDAIYSTAPLILPLGAGLGEWEEIERDDIFIVQPGIYWSSNTADKPKTRGIPRSLIIERRDQFEAAWRAWIAGDGGDEAPAVMVPIQIFAGHRYAINRGNVDLAGRWLTVPKAIEFEWRHKRQPAARSLAGTLYTRPYAGHAELQSESYDPDELTDILAQSLEMEAAPDYEPWGNSGE